VAMHAAARKHIIRLSERAPECTLEWCISVVVHLCSGASL
jgi:hypothetical protein